MTSAGSKSHKGLIYSLYFLARVVAFPLLVLYFLFRGYRDPRYFRNFMERLGTLPVSFKRTAPGSIWLHAVSVGEVISAVRVIAEIRAANPNIPVYLSTTTLAGRAIAHQKLSTLVNGIFFAPIDYVFAVRRVLRRIRPAVVVILETEIWPSLYCEVKRAGCGLLVVNGRISNRALPRYRRFRPFFKATLCWPDTIHVQTETDRARYIEIGAPAGNVNVLGNLKYDAVVSEAGPPQAIAHLMDALRPEPSWIAASTMPGVDGSDVDETDLVLDVFETLSEKYHHQLLILAPRKPERFDQTAAALHERGIHFLRRSQMGNGANLRLPGVLLLDSMGELASVFPLADAVFMGGTLARRGGHNILEPASAARPIVIGPHMENFAAIAEEFRKAEAVVGIAGPDGLAAALDDLLSDAGHRAELGRRAAALAESKQGVTERAVWEILKAQDAAVPAWNLRGPMKTVAGWLSLLWIGGGAIKRHAARSLGTPVISVGGIAMGGSGKTPFVLMLARLFKEQGIAPAILTRGYRRKSLAKMIVVDEGGSVAASVTGDEAQIFVRSGIAHVGICSDRYSAGRAIEERHHPGVFLLDDGFQHRALARNVDLVLIDALDPFAGGAVFPRGRLREPLTALAHADALVITRAQSGREYRGLRERLRELNPDAPVFLATVEPKRWVDAATGEETAQPAGPAAAFCGLGNPNSFWETLRCLGIAPVFTWPFSDHHVYRPEQLRRLSSQARSKGAAVLLTTQKDAMNLPENFAALLAPVRLYWLEVESRAEDVEGLMKVVWSGLAGR